MRRQDWREIEIRYEAASLAGQLERGTACASCRDTRQSVVKAIALGGGPPLAVNFSLSKPTRLDKFPNLVPA